MAESEPMRERVREIERESERLSEREREYVNILDFMGVPHPT